MALYSVTTTAAQESVLAAANIGGKAIAVFVQDSMDAKIAQLASVLQGTTRDAFCTAINALTPGDPKLTTALNALK